MDRRLAAAVVVKHLAIVVATVGFAPLERELRRNELFGIRPIMFFGWSWKSSINSGGKRAGSSVIEQAFETIVIGDNVHRQSNNECESSGNGRRRETGLCSLLLLLL